MNQTSEIPPAASGNTVTCHDCPTTMTRGNAHVRSQAFVQVFYCGPCMTWRRRLAELVRWAHGGGDLPPAPSGGTLSERVARVGGWRA